VGLDEANLVFKTQTDNEDCSYYNPILQSGSEKFARVVMQARIAGVLAVDLPAEAAAPLHAQLRQRGIDLIFLVAPTTMFFTGSLLIPVMIWPRESVFTAVANMRKASGASLLVVMIWIANGADNCVRALTRARNPRAEDMLSPDNITATEATPKPISAVLRNFMAPPSAHVVGPTRNQG
jgi:hypothetical protein